MFVLWLGEKITDRGIGNGVSLIIMIGIIARFPSAIVQEFISRMEEQAGGGLVMLLIEFVLLFVVFMLVIMLVQGTRKIPVQYAKRIVGNKQYGGVRQYIPLKINSKKSFNPFHDIIQHRFGQSRIHPNPEGIVHDAIGILKISYYAEALTGLAHLVEAGMLEQIACKKHARLDIAGFQRLDDACAGQSILAGHHESKPAGTAVLAGFGQDKPVGNGAENPATNRGTVCTISSLSSGAAGA